MKLTYFRKWHRRDLQAASMNVCLLRVKRTYRGLHLTTVGDPGRVKTSHLT
jgi:hypothetical protein